MGDRMKVRPHEVHREKGACVCRGGSVQIFSGSRVGGQRERQINSEELISPQRESHGEGGAPSLQKSR